MNANSSVSIRSTGFLTGACLFLSGAGLSDARAQQADAFPVFDSYIKVTGQAASISGSKASFARRAQQPESGAGGIEALYYAQDLSNDRTVVLEGRALAGVEDYLGRITLSKFDVGSVDLGYKRFRTFYDGIGNFFPLNKQWYALNPQELHIDRGEFSVGARLTFPDKPELEVRYTNRTRTGRKDSTITGRSDFTGLPNFNPPISSSRGLYPGYIDLSERTEVLKGIVKGNLGKTSYDLELFTERTKDASERFVINFPGEVRPFPNPASSVQLPPQSVNNQQTITSLHGNEVDSWGLIANARTQLSDKIQLISGFSYHTLDSDFTGDRPLVTSTNTAVGVIEVPSNNFENLSGSAEGDVYVARLGADVKVTGDLDMKLLVRWEDKYTRSAMTYTNFTSSVNTTTGAVTENRTLNQGYSRFKDESWTPELDVRYTGISNLTLYANAVKKQVDGDQNYAAPHSTVTPSTGNLSIMDTDETREKYTFGGSWRAAALLTLRGEVFYKDNTLHYVGYDVKVGDNYQLDTKFTGYKVTVIAKPANVVSFTTRYTYQKGEGRVTGYLPTFPAYDALDMTVHTLSETINWTPNDQFYMQGNLNLVYNVFGTIYPRAGVAPASGANASWDVNGLVQNADNNYVYGSIVAGAVLTKRDDLQVQFNYYKADNYNPQLAVLSMPYGASARDISVTVGLKHKFTDRMVGEFKVGYFDSDNPTTGGNTNFKGPVGYFSLNHAL